MKQADPEIRALVVKACLEGRATRRQLSEIFGYHVDTMSRWVRNCRNGQTIPLPRGHRKSVFSAEEKKELESYIQENPYITLNKIREVFGKDCSLVTVHNVVKSLGYVKTGKKNARWLKRQELA